MMKQPCSHLKQIKPRIRPRTPSGCAECLSIGYHDWNSLRLCLTCGHVGCCDDSKYKHATAHFKETGHPIMRGYKTKHRYKWCFVHERTVG
jgi:CPA1 family monovalent cation:H+ antiporter